MLRPLEYHGRLGAVGTHRETNRGGERFCEVTEGRELYRSLISSLSLHIPNRITTKICDKQQAPHHNFPVARSQGNTQAHAPLPNVWGLFGSGPVPGTGTELEGRF